MTKLKRKLLVRFTLPVISLLICACQSQQQLQEVYLFSTEINNAITNQTNETNSTHFATQFSFVPDFDRLKRRDELEKLERPAINYTNLFRNYTEFSAAKYIVTESDKYSLLVLNESHLHPTHRRFALSLLRGLYKNGYRYLGAETLNKNIDFTQANSPATNWGYYVAEPTYAQFLREAIALGFTLFAYEANAGIDGIDREIEQAQNIHSFMKNHTEGKVFIYCGFGHNNEEEMEGWGKVMAGRLKDLTGVDPLTVNQTYFNDIKPVKSNYAIVLQDTAKNIYHPYTANDIYVFHPIYNEKDIKLNWKKQENNTWLKVDFLPKETVYPVFVKVYLDTETGNKIPYDIIELKDVNEQEWLFVPNQNHTLFIHEKGNSEVELLR